MQYSLHEDVNWSNYVS